MDSVRDELIGILRVPIFPHELADPTEAVADYLLDNGVTIQRWIPVTERLPEAWMTWVDEGFFEPTEFLVFIKDAELPTTLFFDGERWCGLDHADFYEVTHWMPMPDAPKEG